MDRIIQTFQLYNTWVIDPKYQKNGADLMCSICDLCGYNPRWNEKEKKYQIDISGIPCYFSDSDKMEVVISDLAKSYWRL